MPEYKAGRTRCGRISAIVGYGTALIRQMHDTGLVQGVFPANAPGVKLDGWFAMRGSPQEVLQTEKEELEKRQQQQQAAASSSSPSKKKGSTSSKSKQKEEGAKISTHKEKDWKKIKET